MKNQNKNKYFLFLFSLLPGAAEMYMGLMHMGVSLMALFFAGIALVALIGADILLFAPALLWFYGFFHARNLSGCDEETFAAVEDVYIWDEFFGQRVFRSSPALPRKWMATALILCGLAMLWESCTSLLSTLAHGVFHWVEPWILSYIFSLVPRAALSLLLIALGVKLIRGRKSTLAAEQDAAPTECAALPPAEREGGAHE